MQSGIEGDCNNVGLYFQAVFHRFLRAMKAFEAEEALIMKDIPGWKVGESPYISGKWVEPIRGQLKFPPGEDIY